MVNFRVALVVVAAAAIPVADARFVVTKADAERQEACLGRMKNMARRYVSCYYDKEDEEGCWEEAGGVVDDKKSKDKKGKGKDDEEEVEEAADCGGEVGFEHVVGVTEICLDAQISERDAKKMAVNLYTFADRASYVVAGETCEDESSCFGCVRSGCKWSGDMCRGGCLSDGPCYSKTTGFKGMSNKAICEVWKDRKRDANPRKGECAEGSSCLDCLSNDCVFSGDRCVKECLQDAPCVKQREGTSNEATCKRVEDNKKDSTACRAQNNCGDCLGTSLPSDGDRACRWFARENGDGFCVSFRSPLQVGEEKNTCDTNTARKGKCAEGSSCLDCLSNGCVFSGDTCAKECLQDAPCDKQREGTSNEATCKRVEDNKKDSTACREQNNCGDCLGTSLPSDDDRACRWFARENGDGFCVSFRNPLQVGEEKTTCEP